MKPKNRPDLATQLLNARLAILERALIAFIEHVDDKVPTDEEILREGFHLTFSDTPLTVVVREPLRFTQYYVWRGKHVVGYGFLNEQRVTDLSVVRLPDDEWPAAVCAAVEKWSDKQKEKGAGE